MTLVELRRSVARARLRVLVGPEADFCPPSTHRRGRRALAAVILMMTPSTRCVSTNRSRDPKRLVGSSLLLIRVSSDSWCARED